MRRHQQQGGQDDPDTEQGEPGRVNPAKIGYDPRQEAVRVADGQLDIHDAGPGGQPLASLRLFAALVELLGRLRRFLKGQAGRQELLAEALNPFQRHPLGPVVVLEGLLNLIEGMPAVQVAENVMFLLREIIVFEGDRVLDDDHVPAFVFL